MATTRFNVRVYGLWVEQGKVWVNDELIQGRRVLKFPGGGLEYGEGTIECLKREWLEEFDIEIEVHAHFYTTDFFQRSFFDNSQVVSIYYFVRPLDISLPIKNSIPQDQARWLDISDIGPHTFPLPIDTRVGEMLRALNESANSNDCQ